MIRNENLVFGPRWFGLVKVTKQIKQYIIK